MFKIKAIFARNKPRAVLIHMCKRFNRSCPPAFYRGFMEQLEAECNRVCRPPRVPKQKVTIFGAGCEEARIISMILKQQSVVKTLCLFDAAAESGASHIANDLAHIDTSTQLELYEGWCNLPQALKNAEVVLLCGDGGAPETCCCACARARDATQFNSGANTTRAAALAFAKFCPEAFLAIAVRPVDCNFTLVAHTLQKAGVLNNRRLLGVNSLAAMRANSLACALVGVNPRAEHVPVVGGCGSSTCVPVFSAHSNVSSCYFPQDQFDVLVNLVRDADRIICNMKSCTGRAHLSSGFAVARCVINIMNGLFDKPAFIESALVWQDKPDISYGLPVCCSTVTVGECGIVQFGIPTLNSTEQERLVASADELAERLKLGRCMATGEECCKPVQEQEPTEAST